MQDTGRSNRTELKQRLGGLRGKLVRPGAVNALVLKMGDERVAKEVRTAE